MLFDEGFRGHVLARLALCESEMCTTEPDVRMLCDFIMVLLEKECFAEELREMMVTELAGFLHAETEAFVSQIFSDLVSKPWENAHIPQDKAPVESRVLLAATANCVKEKTASAPTRLEDTTRLGGCTVAFVQHVAAATRIGAGFAQKQPKAAQHTLMLGTAQIATHKYRCPDCGIAFGKWTKCRAHVLRSGHANAKCSAGLQQRCTQARQNASAVSSASAMLPNRKTQLHQIDKRNATKQQKKKDKELHITRTTKQQKKRTAAAAHITLPEEPFLFCSCSSPCLPGTCPIRDSGKRHTLPTHVRVVAV